MSIENKPESGYDLAYHLAREQIARVDLEEQCRRSGARHIDDRRVAIDYLGQTYEVTLPEADVTSLAGGPGLSVREKILVLHYFVRATGEPLTGRFTAYQELPDGANYLPVFRKRAIKPLLDSFGNDPRKLVEVAARLGAQPLDQRDAAFTIAAFPRVPVTVVLWKGDEEFPADGKMMFDSTISDYLTTDDINVLCETIAWRLVKSAQGRP